MQSDIMLTRGNEVLIIDAKYHTHTTQARYDVHTLHSGNLYQIFTYVKNKDTEFGDEPHRVSGMLLYAATDEAIQPDNSYRMSGNQISVKTLDLNRDFSEIAAQLNAIVDKHFEWVLLLNHNLGSLTNTPVVQRLPQPFNDYGGTESRNPRKKHETPPQNRSVAGFAYVLKQPKSLISSGSRA